MQRTERPVQTRFRCAYTYRFKLARHTKSLTHYTKRYAVTQNKSWAPTVCRHSVSGSLSLPLSGCFSPFPHGTGSLSVMHEYLGLESGLPIVQTGFHVSRPTQGLLFALRVRGCHPFPTLSRVFHLSHKSHWPGPRSLATTNGVSFDVLSSGYLDVSVPRVRL